ncbi:hypothetical protein [Fluviicoccus keumensis]|uniref:hypothetical protein n=1 Tax=Fluviicoccus keumensis TaxID=1435465 RepID=UPI00102CBE21|nr:hypothetical protein [Fluviicoccus keumensis]
MSSLLLTACGGGGGGGGNSDSGTISLSGIAADGYLNGAFVCLDRNDNLRCDTGEPRTMTDSQGAYTLSGLSNADTSSHRVLVEVHTGVIDSDSPGTTVDMAYVLTAPVGKHAFISPFSTLLAGTMRQHPEMTVAQAQDMLGNLLNIPSASLLGNYLNGELTDAGKQRMHRIGRGLAREMAFFTKYVRSMPDYTADMEADILPALGVRLSGSDFLREALDADFSAASVSEKYLDTTTRMNAMETARLLVKFAHQPVAAAVSGQDFMASAAPRYVINDVFPTDCHSYPAGGLIPSPCPTDYPANSVFIRSVTSAINAGTVNQTVTNALWSLADGSALNVALPRYNTLRLTNGDWQFPSATPPSFSVSQLDGDLARTSSLKGLNIRAYLRSTSLINGYTVADAMLQAIPADATFPDGAEASRYLSINHERDYFLSDIDPFNDTFETYAPSKLQSDGGGNFTSLNELLDYFNPAVGNRFTTIRFKTKVIDGQSVLNSVINCQFTTGGDVLAAQVYLNADGSLNHVQPLPSGTWRRFTDSGKEFLQATLPAGILSSDIPLTWTVYNNEVVYVSAFPAGLSYENLYFNEAGITAIRTALQN